MGSKPITVPVIRALEQAKTPPSPPPPPKLVQDYFKSEFYDPMAVGTQAIIPVKLPTGEEYKFVGGAPLAGFQEYLKSIDELPAAIIGAKEGKPEYRYPTFFEQREGSKVEPYITSEDILSKEAYKKRLDPISFLATLPSYVGVVKPPEIPRVPGPPRIEDLSRSLDFLSPDFYRRRKRLSELESEERVPIRFGMQEGGMTNDFISQRKQQSIADALARTAINIQGRTTQAPQVQNYVAPQTVSDPMTTMTEPMTSSYIQRFGFNPYEVYGYPSFIDYNEAKMAGKYNPELEDYLGMLETASSLGVNVPNKAGFQELTVLLKEAQNPYLMGQGIGMKDGGRIGYEAGGVSVDVKSLPATATAAINQFGQDAFNARNLQQYYYPIGATGDADQGAKKPIGLVPAGTILPPKPGTIGYKEPEPTPTPTTSMAGKELRTSVVEQLKRLGFILSDEDLKRILSTYGVLSLKDGGTVETGLTKTIPPVRGPMSEGVESLFRTR